VEKTARVKNTPSHAAGENEKQSQKKENKENDWAGKAHHGGTQWDLEKGKGAGNFTRNEFLRKDKSQSAGQSKRASRKYENEQTGKLGEKPVGKVNMLGKGEGIPQGAGLKNTQQRQGARCWG